MSIEINIHDGPLPVVSETWDRIDGIGALITFEGIVRPIEDGRHLFALDYEAYEPMASQQLRRLADDLFARHRLQGVYVEHSVGRVPVGAVSFRLRIASRHRKEGLAGMDEFIDRMKQDIPIWKTAIWHDPQVQA
jgi:molybdopterin synthase catalytic subunit